MKMEHKFSMSPVEMHKTCPVLTKKMRLHYLTIMVSLVNCHIYWLLFEIALLRVYAQIRIG